MKIKFDHETLLKVVATIKSQLEQSFKFLFSSDKQLLSLALLSSAE
ncbi:hypothetical protein PCARR_a0433 [Pseudoalteromonas carrageenovora IAM 12662]|uniref:DNA polymerase III subunit beta n=1 Tax=Pseudoalteromonas carrageenovora IAM 12662 TaxID=1314868 RepID=A0ABR9EQM3_PSEVC|nr:hypothetical protein [Pseudoalteromonas carrageenovora IAM 12662]